jgi:hypothetical protein
LTALGSVIGALSRASSSGIGGKGGTNSLTSSSSSSSSQQQHIRFRDSKLTKLLKKRLLGGKNTTCQVLLIATVDAQLENLTETLSTLKFATRCKYVRTIDPIPSNAVISLRQRNTTTQQQQQQLEDKDHALFKQIFEEMKVMYEQREQMLHVSFMHFCLV